jgi:YggT family protein
MAWLILYYSLEVFKWLIVARALMSWFVAPHSRNPIADLLRRVTDPILEPISRVIPVTGGLDLSPLAAFFLITILQQVVARVA